VSLSEPSFARSSRAAKVSASGDKSGLNFVAYAEDAVPWFTYTKVNGKATPQSKIKKLNLTVSQLAGIYNGTTTNWSLVGGSSAPIDVFMAQNGSGTEGTWVADLGLTGAYPYGGATATATATGLPVSDFEIFENEVSQIFATGLESDAIFFFSYGKYSLLCPKGLCAGVPAKDGKGVTINAKTTVAALGEIGGITASATTIQNGTFPLDRELYNVYSDGKNANLPPVNLDAQNFISTYGFLCNPQTTTEVDPLSPSGATYRTEIDNIISANGFFPIPEGTMGDAHVTPPNFGSVPLYAQADPPPPNDQGFCQVTTTDGDTNN